MIVTIPQNATSRWAAPVGRRYPWQGATVPSPWVGPPVRSGLTGCQSCSGGLGALDVWWPFPGLPMWPTLIGGGLLLWWLLRPRVVQQVRKIRRRHRVVMEGGLLSGTEPSPARRGVAERVSYAARGNGMRGRVGA